MISSNSLFSTSLSAFINNNPLLAELMKYSLSELERLGYRVFPRDDSSINHWEGRFNDLYLKISFISNPKIVNVICFELRYVFGFKNTLLCPHESTFH